MRNQPIRFTRSPETRDSQSKSTRVGPHLKPAVRPSRRPSPARLSFQRISLVQQLNHFWPSLFHVARSPQPNVGSQTRPPPASSTSLQSVWSHSLQTQRQGRPTRIPLLWPFQRRAAQGLLRRYEVYLPPTKAAGGNQTSHCIDSESLDSHVWSATQGSGTTIQLNGYGCPTGCGSTQLGMATYRNRNEQ